MKNKIQSFCKLSDEDILMVVLASICFSVGVWSNYRQLWLEEIGLSVGEISRVLSVSLICSAVMSFLISTLSKKVSIKDVVMLSILFRAFSYVLLLFIENLFLIKALILLGVMCEVIFSISMWPLIATVNKSDKTYRKHALINYISKDAAVIACGLLLGVSFGKYVFDLNGCLIIALGFTLIGAIFLLMFNKEEFFNKEKKASLKESVIKIFNSSTNKYYLFIQFVSNISYGMLFGLMMLILTNYIKFDVSFASIFIIVSNVIGSLVSSYFSKKSDNISVKASVLIKYGTRVILFLIAIIFDYIILYIICIVATYVTSRLLDNKINGIYINRVETSNMFLFGNLRYFLLSLGNGIGVFLAGVMLDISLKWLFIGAGIVTFIQILLMIHLDIMRIKEDE